MNVIVLRRKMNMNYSELLQLAKGWSNFNYVKFMIFFIFQYFLKKLDIQLLYKYNNMISSSKWADGEKRKKVCIMYEYVCKREYAPYREEAEKIIRHAQQIMRRKYNTTFQYKLIGSANRHLVTKIKKWKQRL